MNKIEFLENSKVLLFFLLNLFLFILMGIDKKRAQSKKWRIPEKRLLLLGLLGGGTGGLAGMFFFRHKTHHYYFYLVYGVGFITMLSFFLS